MTATAGAISADTRPIQYLVFTDMDGTLLDHHTYSHAAAAPMLDRLQQHGIPVIPNTSKTVAELKVLRKQLALATPFIVENGAAAYLPHGFLRQKPQQTQWQDEFWVRQFTSRKRYWLNVLEQVREQFEGQFTHFDAMSTEQICESTGLSADEAQRAAQRQYGEPVLWLGDNATKSKFVEAVRAKGATPLQGGRFLHVSGECDKGTAMRWLVSEVQRQSPEYRCVSIALGDGHNDVAMLEAADIAIRILSPSHAPPELQRSNHTYTSTLYGPEGWFEVLNELIPSK